MYTGAPGLPPARRSRCLHPANDRDQCSRLERSHYRDAELLIERGSTPVGRFYLHHGVDDLLVIDISLLPASKQPMKAVICACADRPWRRKRLPLATPEGRSIRVRWHGTVPRRHRSLPAMPSSSLLLGTNLAYAKGGYTVALEFGSQRDRANLLLDTGSSSLVVLPTAYDASSDRSLQPTAWAQQVKYGQGSWAGPVLMSELGLGEGIHARRLSSVPFALVEADAQNFRDYDGLFGLAFGRLNKAHDMSAVLAERHVSPALTWPWPFAVADSELDDFRKLLRQQPTIAVTPLFTAAEELGVVSDKFAMQIRRSLVHVLDDESTPRALANDPLNRGVLVLGGGEEHQDLYEGPFHDVRIVHELYYNANLIAVQVGSQPRIAAPALAPDEVARAASNAIFDTGSTFLILESSLYDAVRDGFAAHDPALPPLIDRFQEDFKQERGLPNSAINHRDWPDLHFYLESGNGDEVKLTCTPGDYWQRNALRAGLTYFLLMNQLPNWPRQSILGLPLMSGYYCIFDRRGSGVLRLAKAQDR